MRRTAVRDAAGHRETFCDTDKIDPRDRPTESCA
jgi:hypothetical protein